MNLVTDGKMDKFIAVNNNLYYLRGFQALCCLNDVEIGDDRSIGVATTYHEVIDPAVKTPAGDFRGFGFPMTNSNPLGKVGFQQVGIPSHPAKDLVAEFEIIEEIDPG